MFDLTQWHTSITTEVGRWTLEGQLRTIDDKTSLRVLAVCGEDVHELAEPVFPALDVKATHVFAATTKGFIYISKEV